MDCILEKNIERYIKIINCINSKRNKIDEIADFIQVTKKTIKTDIESFNFFSDNYQLVLDKQNNVSLIFDEQISHTDIYESILQQSTTLQLILLIFKGRYSVRNLQDILYLSRTNVKKRIAKINTYFETHNYDISVSNENILDFLGDEIQIREFFYHLFLESGHIKMVRHYHHIHISLTEIFNELNLDFDQTHYSNNWCIYIIVAMIRNGKGHHLKDRKINNEQYTEKLHNLFINKKLLSTELDRSFRFKLSKENIQDLFYFDLHVIQLNNQWVLEDEANTFLINRIKDFINELLTSTEKELIISNFNSLIKKILFQITYQPSIYFFRIDMYNYFYPLFEELYLDLIDRFEKKLSMYILKREKFFYKRLLIDTLMNSALLADFLEPELHKKNVLIISNNVNICTLYEKMILNRYPFLDAIKKYSLVNEDIEFAFVKQFDIVLLDSKISVPLTLKQNVIKLSEIPCNQFWRHFENQLKVETLK